VLETQRVSNPYPLSHVVCPRPLVQRVRPIAPSPVRVCTHVPLMLFGLGGQHNPWSFSASALCEWPKFVSIRNPLVSHLGVL
jgi:hypothetical protein